MRNTKNNPSRSLNLLLCAFFLIILTACGGNNNNTEVGESSTSPVTSSNYLDHLLRNALERRESIMQPDYNVLIDFIWHSCNSFIT